MNTENSIKKRDYTKFFTYPETAKFMVELLQPKDNDVILEPSAGNGALCKAIKEFNKETKVFAVEIDEQWRDELKSVCDVVVIQDFLDEFTEVQPKYSGIIANPPFGNGVDLQAHYDKMMRMLKVGGKLVAILPLDFKIDFDDFLNEYPLENWSKNSDGTKTEIKIVEVVKPNYSNAK